jgi:photosystem II stability/assembly factor-like uncharacterized protein
MGNFVRVLLSVLFFSPFFFSQTISWQQLSGPHGGAIYSIVRDNSGNFYANTIGSPGPYKSTDNGESWFSIMNGLTPGDNGGFHPLNINSNGDLFIGGAHNAGYLCRSTDGGISWTFLNNLDPGSSIICIAFDNNDNVYVGTGTGIYKSTDNGDSWSQYGMNGSGVEAVAFNDSGHVFAGNSYAVYRSKDDGVNWTQLPTGGGTRTVSVAPNGYIFAGCWENAGILRSTDNGNSWTYVYPQIVSVYFASTILFDTNGDIYFPTYGKGVLRSTDDGDTWTEMNNGIGYNNIRALAKNSTGSLLAGGAYALYKSTNAGSNWYSVGLPICGVNHIIINSNDDIFAGVYGVNRSTDGGQTWQTKNNGLVNLDIRALAVKENGYLFAGTNDSPDGTVFSSTDNGENWVRVDNFPTGIAINGLAVGLNGEIIATATGYNYLCQKSTDDGTSWQDISYGNNIGWGKVAFNSSGDLFMASYGAGLWKLPVGDTTWVDLTANYGYNWIPSLFIASNDYLYAGGRRSTDNGLTWTDLSLNQGYTKFAENSIGHIFCGTSNYGAGVWRSIDNGDTWEQINSGLPTMDVRSVAVDSDDYLYAGPWGYSLFKTTTSTVTDIADIKFTPTGFSLEQNFPNPFNPNTIIKWQSPIGGLQTLKVYDVLGNEIAILVNEYRPAGNYEVNFDASGLTSGIYFYQLKAVSFVETKKMILVR